MVDHVFDDLPAYALGSLDPEESLRVAAHIEGCSLCQQELQTYRMVVDQLPIAAPQRTPPPGLRNKILNQVASSPGSTINTQQRSVSFLQRLRDFFSHPVPTWSLVGALVLVLALVTGGLAWYQKDQVEARNAKFQVVQLSGTSVAQVASGWIVVTRDGQAGTLVVQSLPALKTDQQYQLWLIRDGKRDNGGVFSVDQNGYASLWVWSPRPLKDYQQFGITIEPTGGSPGPTGPKVMGGKF